MLQTLHHIQLAMPAGQEDEARVFYGTVLGLPEKEKPDSLAPRGGCWFQQGGISVHLGVEDPFQPAKKAHPAFTVQSLEDATARLSAYGHAATSPERLPGLRRIYTQDPFGNRIELVAID